MTQSTIPILLWFWENKEEGKAFLYHAVGKDSVNHVEGNLQLRKDMQMAWYGWQHHYKGERETREWS